MTLDVVITDLADSAGTASTLATTLCGVANASSITYGSGTAPEGNPVEDVGGETTFSNTLGGTQAAGAALVTPVPGNYFPEGSTPAVSATFTSAWAGETGAYDLAYAFASSAQVVADTWPSFTTVPLTQATTDSGGGLSLPLSVPTSDTGPGVYLVNADLENTSTGAVQGSTCLEYSVGMPGDTLNLTSLEQYEATDYGPFPERGVELAAELGTGLFRQQLSVGALLPACVTTAVTPATCGPSALDFSDLPEGGGEPSIADYASAATLAQSLGVNFEVQVGQGGAVENALVNYDIANGYGAGNANNLWESDVTAIVEYFAQNAPDLVDFEAWNEPNDTWSPGAASYVDNILAPFYDGVQAANTASGHKDQVLGGTVVGTDLTYWDAIASAGGFSDMNIVSIHPYTGYDGSYEEQGVPTYLSGLTALMANYGVGSMPIWDTEQGWWSDGFATFWDVGDFAARAWMWNKSFGITNWNYYTEEGESEGGQPSFSLVELTYGDDYVKPDGIALMTVSTLLGDRPYLGMATTGIPHTYAMLFGEAPGTSDDIEALWTDDLPISAQVTLTSGDTPATIPTTGVFGTPGSLSVATGTETPISLSGAPIYLAVPAGDTLGISATESFGPDLALANGTTATASSNAGSAAEVIRATTVGGTTVPDASNDEGADYGGWSAATGDPSPTLTVTFPTAQPVDRVIVSTTSLGSILVGLEDYEVQLDEGGAWTTVATETDQLQQRMALFTFPAATASGVQVVVQEGADGSEAGGLPPWYWSSSYPSETSVYSVEAYAPGTTSQPAPPTVTGVSPGGGSTSGGTVVTVTGTGLSAATGVSFGSTPAASFSVTSATSITATAPAGGAGTVNVTVTTPQGTSATSSSDQFSYGPSPALGIWPTSGPTAGGTLVTIAGANLSGGTVYFGSTAAAGSCTAASCTATAPPAAAGPVAVTVETGDGTSNPETFTYVALPTVTAVTPDTGTVQGGDSIRVSGTSLKGATAIDFGPDGAGTILWCNSAGTECAVTDPAGAAGTVDVTVTTPQGTSATSSADQFTYEN